MSEPPPETDNGYEWARAYLALSRTGVVTPEIESCETEWAQEFWGTPSAVQRIRQAQGYPAYAEALRAALGFPLVLYWVARDRDFQRWQAGRPIPPIAATFVLRSAQLLMDVHPDDRPAVLARILVSEPQAVIMRGRISRYTLVLEPTLVDRANVRVLPQL